MSYICRTSNPVCKLRVILTAVRVAVCFFHTSTTSGNAYFYVRTRQEVYFSSSITDSRPRGYRPIDAGSWEVAAIYYIALSAAK